MPITKITTYRKNSVDRKQTRAIRSLKKDVKALQAPVELKYLYSTISDSGLNSNATSLTINLVRPWDSSSVTANNDRLNYREGFAINMRRFMLKGKLQIPYPPLGATVDRRMPTRCRFIYVYYAEEPPGNNIDDILEIPPGQDLVDAFYKRNGRLKYKVLKDVIFSLEPNYWNYSDPSTPSNESYSGMAATKPAFITVRHNLDLTKLPNMGRANWNDATSLAKIGQLCLYYMTDNIHYDIKLKASTQLTFQDVV